MLPSLTSWSVFSNPSQFCPSSSSPSSSLLQANSGWPASVHAGRQHILRYPAASPLKLCHLLSTANRNTNVNEHHLPCSEHSVCMLGYRHGRRAGTSGQQCTAVRKHQTTEGQSFTGQLKGVSIILDITTYLNTDPTEPPQCILIHG